MGRVLRHLPDSRTVVEITNRTVQERFLLKPSAELNQLILGVIGKALADNPEVKLHMMVVMSNHYHMLASASDMNSISRFMCMVNTNISKEAGIVNDWKGGIFYRPYTMLNVLDNECLMQKVKYLLSHGVKENLVTKPEDWPGVNCIKALTEGKKMSGLWINRGLKHALESSKERRMRTAERKGNLEKARDLELEDYSDKYEIVYDVPLTTLPIFEGLSAEETQTRYKNLIEEIEEEQKALYQETKVQPAGEQIVLGQHPHKKSENPNRSPRPICLTSDEELRDEYKEEYKAYVNKFREAVEWIMKGSTKGLMMLPKGCCLPPMAYKEIHLVAA